MATVDLSEASFFDVLEKANVTLDRAATVVARLIPLDRDLGLGNLRRLKVQHVRRCPCRKVSDMFRPGPLTDAVDGSDLEPVEL